MISLRKIEKTSQNIAFMALMAAINVIFVLMTTFVPFLLFLLVFILPLSCTLVVLLCKKHMFPIYAFSTIGLCLLVTIYNISDTLFYIIPSIITGSVFAFCIEKKVPYQFSIILSTFVQFGLSYALLPLIELITQVDLLLAFAKMLKLESHQYLTELNYIAVFIISFVQSLVSYLFIKLGLKKLNFEMTKLRNENFLILAGLIITLLLTLLFVFVYPKITFIFFASSIYFAAFIIFDLILNGNKYTYTAIVVFFFVFLLLLGLLYGYVREPLGILLIQIYLYIVGIIAFINNFLVNKGIK